MKKYILNLIAVAACAHCFAQAKFDPQVLVLSPNDFHCDAAMQKEVQMAEDNIKNGATAAVVGMFGNADKINTLPPNARLMAQNEASYAMQITFSNEISLLAQQYIACHFSEKFPDVLALLSKEKSAGDIDDMQRLSVEEKEPYILNFPSVYIYRENNVKYCKLRVQLYEQRTNTMLVDTEYKGDWNNSGFEFTSEQGSIPRSVNNALSQALSDVSDVIAVSSPTIVNEHRLAKERSDYVRDSIFPHPFEQTIAMNAIAHDDKRIDPNSLYQCLYNSDSTRFVAFFLQSFSERVAASAAGNKQNDQVTVLTLKSVLGGDYLGLQPQTYAYVVRGVLYQGKWYYEKSGATYFDPSDLNGGKVEYLNNLQQWGYFAPGTSNPAVGFWRSSLFDKIIDKRTTQEGFKAMWVTEKRENRP